MRKWQLIRDCTYSSIGESRHLLPLQDYNALKFVVFVGYACIPSVFVTILSDMPITKFWQETLLKYIQSTYDLCTQFLIIVDLAVVNLEIDQIKEILVDQN